MSNLDKYNKVFSETFNVDAASLSDDFSSDNVKKWDSMLQLSLVTNIEDDFDVMFEPEDIMEFKSYGKGKSILAKHGVEI